MKRREFFAAFTGGAVAASVAKPVPRLKELRNCARVASKPIENQANKWTHFTAVYLPCRKMTITYKT